MSAIEICSWIKVKIKWVNCYLSLGKCAVRKLKKFKKNFIDVGSKKKNYLFSYERTNEWNKCHILNDSSSILINCSITNFQSCSQLLNWNFTRQSEYLQLIQMPIIMRFKYPSVNIQQMVCCTAIFLCITFALEYVSTSQEFEVVFFYFWIRKFH